MELFLLSTGQTKLDIDRFLFSFKEFFSNNTYNLVRRAEFEGLCISTWNMKGI